MSLFTPTGGASSSSSSVTTPDLNITGVSISKITTPGTANTETSTVFADTTKFFRIRARGNARLRLAYTATGSADGFTVIPGNIYETPGILKLSGSLTLYLQSNKASTEVEIETWT